MSEQLVQGLAVVDLGSGNLQKAAILLEALVEKREKLLYVPVDMFGPAIEAASEKLLKENPTLEIKPIVGEYDLGVSWMKDNPDQAKLVLWLGSNLGNFDRRSGAHFLQKVSRYLSSADRVLLGVDFRKDAAVLERAYDDSEGLTARFNLNLLERINRELGGQFDLGAFRHEASYDEEAGRVILGLRSLREQQVPINRLRRSIEFKENEFIHTEDSFKYSYEEVEGLVANAGLSIQEHWNDNDRRFGVFLLKLASVR